MRSLDSAETSIADRLRAAGLCVALWAASAACAQLASPGAAEALSSDAQTLLHGIRVSNDNAGAPFALIDKRLARLWVFDARGRELASAPVLLGQARGDDSVPGIGERPMALITEAERTTPAGRFTLEPGHNLRGDQILWVDYDAAVSMHRVRPTNPAERRLQRLATPTPQDNRISYGCINVPVAFFDAVVAPVFMSHGGLIYILPETRPLAATFPIHGRPDRRSERRVAGGADRDPTQDGRPKPPAE